MKKRNLKRIGALSLVGFLMGLFVSVASYPVVETKAEEDELSTIGALQTDSKGVIDVTDYEVEITVNNDYTVDVSERVTVEFVSEDTQSPYS